MRHVVNCGCFLGCVSFFVVCFAIHCADGFVEFVGGEHRHHCCLDRLGMDSELVSVSVG